MDESLLKILNEKRKTFDENIFNLDAMITNDMIGSNEAAKKKLEQEKLRDVNKYRIYLSKEVV